MYLLLERKHPGKRREVKIELDCLYFVSGSKTA
jgi:hypothetical protein